MLQELLLVIVPMGVIAACVRFKSKLVNFYIQAKYELVYWALGTLAVGDDIIWGWKNKLKEIPDKSNQVAIVTGGARGLGLEVVKVLLKCNMTVVIACRNVNAGKRAVDKLRETGITTGTAEVLPLDTANQEAVKSFAKIFNSKYDSLHLLINNAGIMFVPYKLTEDGFESQLAVNYLGHFQLTHLLMDPLIRGGRASGSNSRVVNVSSCAHIPGAINYKDIHYQTDLYIPSQAYAQSKLAQIMFTKAVERKLKSKNLPVSIYSLHPGVVNTELFDGTVLKKIMPWAPGLFFKRPEQGATTILYVALSSEVENDGGAYFANCRKSFISSLARNQEEQEKLMAFTQDMLRIEDFGELSQR